MDKLLVKKISLFVGGILVFATGLFYVLMTDLLMRNNATWLFIGIIFALGSSVVFFLSESLKEKITPYLLLKCVSILLAIGFVAFLFVFKAKSQIYSAIILPEKISQANLIIIICAVFGSLGVGTEILNSVMGFLTRNDE